MAGRARIKRMSENLEIEFAGLLPNCAGAMLEANDQAIPLEEVNPKHPYLKELTKVVDGLWFEITGEAAEPEKKSKSLFGFGR